jgi:hypothetical protein
MVELRADVAQARKAMRVLFGARREIKRLHEYLRRDEQVDAMVAGKYGDGRGLVAVTNRRVILLHNGIFSVTNRDFNLHTIASVEWHSGLFLGQLVLFGEGSEERITGVWVGDGKKLASLVRDRSGRPLQVTQVEAQAPVNVDPDEAEAVRARLERLERLRKSGMISEEEFASFKRKLTI